jgi:four helix bundle protein
MFRFACDVVGLCGELHALGGIARAMIWQLVGCGTAGVAMLEEARAAESRRDFISKCSIGLKETREAHELVSILTAILRNTKRRM